MKFFYSADYPALVVKASGLAAGKGVVVATNQEEACDAVKCILGDKKYGKAGDTVIVEELLQGEEVSVSSFPTFWTTSKFIIVCLKTIQRGLMAINYTPRKLCLWEGIMFSRCPSVRTKVCP